MQRTRTRYTSLWPQIFTAAALAAPHAFAAEAAPVAMPEALVRAQALPQPAARAGYISGYILYAEPLCTSHVDDAGIVELRAISAYLYKMLANYGNDRQFFQAETQGEKDSRTDFAINLNDKRQDPRPYCEAARTIGRQLQR